MQLILSLILLLIIVLVHNAPVFHWHTKLVVSKAVLESITMETKGIKNYFYLIGKPRGMLKRSEVFSK